MQFSRAAQEEPDHPLAAPSRGQRKLQMQTQGSSRTPAATAQEAGACGNGPPLAKAAEREGKQTRATPAWWGIGGHRPRSLTSQRLVLVSRCPADGCVDLGSWESQGESWCLRDARDTPGFFSLAPKLAFPQSSTEEAGGKKDFQEHPALCLFINNHLLKIMYQAEWSSVS